MRLPAITQRRGPVTLPWMNADLVSKSFTNAVLLSFSWYSRLISYQLSAKGSFSGTCVPAATYYKPFWNLLPPPLHSFSDIAHFRMDRMSQPLYWPSERPAERTCPEWAVGGRVVCGGWAVAVQARACALSQWAVPYIGQAGRLAAPLVPACSSSRAGLLH